MGELVQSTEIESELEKNPETETAKLAGNKSRKMNSTAGGGAAASRNSGSVVRWERFLPNMAMRVLLVEADDSTRQIVGALLRKCSYKVAAASDGLKAWELIKSRPHSIDLILTEVELPSISGYALLTLIMEHDICKNIPVIMMSSHDSVSTVYNCMLRGAADFLVKPLRKNELRNLWQHVWRKQTSSASGPGPPEDSLAQQIIEATAENNDVSNHSSGNMACLKRNWEFIERGSDAQSSCTKPELAVEEAKCFSDDVIIYTQDECTQEHAKTRALNNNGTTQKHDNNSDDGLLVNVISQNSDSNNNAPGNSSREAIDLIGPFDNYLKGSFRVPISNASMNKFDSLPPLDPSLKRFKPSCSVNQVNDERRRLNHSDASAFSRYINSPLQPQNYTSPSTCNQQQENHETNPEKQLSNHTPDRNSNRISSQKHISGPTFSHPEPIPVKRVRIENVMNGCVSMIPQMYPPHSGPSPLSSPGIVNNLQFYPQLHSLYPSDVQPLSSQQFYIIDQMDSQKMENLEDESGSSNFYTNPVSDRSLQRIAALSKFRLKRKDRCFVKKVRYEGRKKLAEQRPRVKGQFVRHLPNSPQLGSSSDD